MFASREDAMDQRDGDAVHRKQVATHARITMAGIQWAPELSRSPRELLSFPDGVSVSAMHHDGARSDGQQVGAGASPSWSLWPHPVKQRWQRHPKPRWARQHRLRVPQRPLSPPNLRTAPLQQRKLASRFPPPWSLMRPLPGRKVRPNPT
jgi:hypothetical protein